MSKSRKRLLSGLQTPAVPTKITKSITNIIEKELPDHHNSNNHLLALKHENLNKNQFLYHWQRCIKERIQCIKTSSVQDVLEKWPQYNQSYGHYLVSEQF